MQKKMILTEPHDTINEFRLYLYEKENAQATIEKYLTDIKTFFRFLENDYEISKQRILEYKVWLQQHYAISSTNSMLVALSQFLDFLGAGYMKVKQVKVQKQMMRQEDRILSEKDYHQLLKTANAAGKKDLALIMETIASTGIRISELKCFTVHAVKCGRVIINNKGKIRRILIPQMLRKKILHYCSQRRIRDGIIFITRNGNALNRSNIWTQMKRISRLAGISAKKVYPHAFRHLFARIYYRLTSDLSGLADILGHSSIETTRIYTTDTEKKYLSGIERLEKILNGTRTPRFMSE